MAANAISPLSDNHGSSAAVPTPAPTAFSAARRETLVIVYFLAGPHPRSQMPRMRRALRACARWHGRRRFLLSRGDRPPTARFYAAAVSSASEPGRNRCSAGLSGPRLAAVKGPPYERSAEVYNRALER